MMVDLLFPEFDEKEQKKRKELLRTRAAASFIDYMTFFLFFMFMPFAIGVRTETGYSVRGILAYLPIFYWVIYFIVVEKLFSGTLGKLLVDIRVVNSVGGKITWSQAIKRRLSDIVEIVWCFGMVAYVNASNNANSKRVGDIWANTRVVKST